MDPEEYERVGTGVSGRASNTSPIFSWCVAQTEFTDESQIFPHCLCREESELNPAFIFLTHIIRLSPVGARLRCHHLLCYLDSSIMCGTFPQIEPFIHSLSVLYLPASAAPLSLPQISQSHPLQGNLDGSSNLNPIKNKHLIPPLLYLRRPACLAREARLCLPLRLRVLVPDGGQIRPVAYKSGLLYAFIRCSCCGFDNKNCVHNKHSHLRHIE